MCARMSRPAPRETTCRAPSAMPRSTKRFKKRVWNRSMLLDSGTAVASWRAIPIAWSVTNHSAYGSSKSGCGFSIARKQAMTKAVVPTSLMSTGIVPSPPHSAFAFERQHCLPANARRS